MAKSGIVTLVFGLVVRLRLQLLFKYLAISELSPVFQSESKCEIDVMVIRSDFNMNEN